MIARKQAPRTRRRAGSAPGLRGLVTTWLLCVCVLHAEPLLEEGFEDPDGWRKAIHGKAAVSIVAEGVEGNAVKVQADGGTGYYSRELDIDRVRGKTVSLRSQVRLEDVRVGEPAYCTAKLHMAVTSGGRTQHHATRFSGTADWHSRYLSVDVPKDADRVVVDLGIQDSFGTVWYDDVVIDDGVREHKVLSLKRVANTGMEDHDPERGKGGFIDAGDLDLRDIPRMFVRLAGADFELLPPAANFGWTCAVLQGAQRPDFPRSMHTMIPVQAKGRRLFFLQAAAWADTASKNPCLTYDVAYADGEHETIVMREGIEIGSFQNPVSLPNWEVAWTAKPGETVVGVGVTEWVNPRPDSTILWLRPTSSGRHGVPIILAVSLDPQGAGTRDATP